MYMTFSLQPLYKAENQYQSVLAILFIVYLMSNMVLPPSLTSLINTQIGMATVVLLSITVFYHTHPVVGILGFLVAYEMIRTARTTSPTILYSQSQPTFSTKHDKLHAMQPPNTRSLEEDMITNMVPLVVPSDATSMPSSYLPVLSDTKHATPL